MSSLRSVGLLSLGTRLGTTFELNHMGGEVNGVREGDRTASIDRGGRVRDVRSHTGHDRLLLGSDPNDLLEFMTEVSSVPFDVAEFAGACGAAKGRVTEGQVASLAGGAFTMGADGKVLHIRKPKVSLLVSALRRDAEHL
jgi:hypothetical protein